MKDKTCLAAVTKFLINPDQDVVFEALEIIYLLSLHRGNEEILAREPGLIHYTKKFMIDHFTAPKLKKISSDIYANLQNYLSLAPPFQENEPVRKQESLFFQTSIRHDQHFSSMSSISFFI